MKSLFYTAGLFFVLGLTSCKKDKETEQATQTANVSVEMEHVWGMNQDPFYLDSVLVHPISGDTMQFVTAKYYVSNFKLKNSSGSWYSIPESYFLVDVSNPSSTLLNLGNIPAGTYTEMSYVIGVDSTRNVSGAQSGALAPSYGMFWSWNSGYIMFKLEGISPQSSTGSYTYHVGGFSGTNNTVETINHVFTDAMTVSSTDRKIHLSVNMAKPFQTLGSVSSNNMIHMPGATAKQMAIDFHSGFSFGFIQ